MAAPTTIELAGRTVPRIGLGTNRLGYTPENAEFLQAAVEAGLRHIDTAHLYAGGESETTIGTALAPFGPDLVVATKGGYHPGDGAPGRLRDQIEMSFRRLRAETISLYYLHRVDPQTPLENSLGAIKRFVDAGKIEHVGLSEVSVAQIESAREVVPIAAVQNQYSRAERKWDEVVDYCEREGIVFVPFYPLRGSNSPAEAIDWLLERSPAILPIPGTLSIEHLRANLAALDRLPGES